MSQSSPLSTSAILGYLRESVRADITALPLLGLKVCIKAGAALQAGLEHVPSGPIRKLAGRYVLHAGFQLDTLVDALPDFERALLVHQFAQACITRARPWGALCREVLACRPLRPRERMSTVLLLRSLRWLMRSAEAQLGSPERLGFFRDKLVALVSSVVEDMNLEERARDTLDTLAPEYPAMCLSGLEILWLLQGRSLEEIQSVRPVFRLGEQLARVEDDILEVWKEARKGGDAQSVAGRLDRRNLLLNHSLNLHRPLAAALDEACVLAGKIEARLGQELARVAAHPLVPELRRVVTFYPTFMDTLMGPHRSPSLEPLVRLSARAG